MSNVSTVHLIAVYSTPEDIKLRSIDITDPAIIDEHANRRRRSPILVEFVDPNISALDIGRSLEVGANIVKFRMAFSTKNEKVSLLSRMDKASFHCATRRGVPICPIATCAALKTWVKKIGLFADGSAKIEQDSEVILTSNKTFINHCTPNMIYVDYGPIGKDVPIGLEITIGQGSVVLHCKSKRDAESIKCTVHQGGIAKNLETVYFRNHKSTVPFLCKMDMNVLKFCTQYQVDVLTIYYASTTEMIRRIKRLISKAKFKPLLFGGICNQDDINKLDDVLKECDGIMFCREFLLYELEPQQVYRIPRFQKWAAGKCQQVGKPMFISGVFEKVLIDGTLSGPEIADVTNALMDGVTGFMLRDCYDIDTTLAAISGLNKICCQVEPLTFDKNVFWRMLKESPVPVNAAEAAVQSCVVAANQTNARVVVISTISGRTARFLLWLRPACIIITVCTRPRTARLLFTFRNIVPLIYTGNLNQKWKQIEEDRLNYAVNFAVTRHWMEYGDTYIALQRSYKGHLFCDTVKVMTVTIASKMLVECHYDSKESSKESFTEEKPVEKKRRKKKKKKVPIEEEKKTDGEETSETEILKDDTTTATEEKTDVEASSK